MWTAPAVSDVLIKGPERVISVERVIEHKVETPIPIFQETIVDKVGFDRFACIEHHF